jgi:hypothetical protein
MISFVVVAGLDAPAKPRCAHVLDATVPDDTKIEQPVEFETGKTTVGTFDRIVITEVLGTSPRFAVGEDYVVRGEYTLATSDDAVLSFSVTAARSGEGCTTNNPRGRVKIKRGSGKFELVGPILYSGFPHVWFDFTGRNVGGSEKTEGVYFGKDDFLLRK